MSIRPRVGLALADAVRIAQVHQGSDRPARGAVKTAICERELTPSLSMMCRMWLATVASEMKSRTPICLLLSPSATSCATSTSRLASEVAAKISGGGWYGGARLREEKAAMPPRGSGVDPSRIQH